MSTAAVVTPSAAEAKAYTASLVDAEQKAVEMFNEIPSLITVGMTEKALSDAIHHLGETKYGVRTHWHKRIIRSGPNTLRPFEDNPPDRKIEADDILVIDLGPVFEKWEADFGRTYVLGDDPEKKAMVAALEPIWQRIKARFDARPDMSGEELYKIAQEETAKDGYDWGAPIAGHIVGHFPHERIPRDKISLYIADGNGSTMASTGKNGHKRHWILEIHARDKQGRYQGFFEQLLTL
ncbi:hypothetical protein CcaverHIS002_0500410 [Cutaneotrichosporon cavernicola]|uniref:Peptidase M24 domain-containing protein n=1 Tax=Cutaneotrichosporon cavernicola TaxID=279322 RepID=A0AA48L7V6_9TREE|nr:uncharacterized protein CcaverHIS019_0600410 [Cutaneotrichosporon cavernicola]BEI84640.1 hypothetical protein CcaverHIS002_0500410 [Cutaneotrichosporon cavernicola]BEI93582.1 hypothetical protein CcaverHIS019_0600410 [Cutaneotrichosporon cavernicola]BEJ01359.1 hypothetical protein CcaverHIS631_0600410 [Cutaneotrichosporon cavernicola]BEJ09126.1 hypothetical protein CcaverHIS641_0600410 [Cutaneotrichosporon cavernicola]